MTTRDRNVTRRRGYTISVAAEIVNVHQQTLRHYEREGLIAPQRGRGQIRYFTEEDIEKLQQIREWVENLGVNLAGVEVMLNMREQMERYREETQQLIDSMRAEHEAEVRRLKEIIWRLQGGAWEAEEAESPA